LYQKGFRFSQAGSRFPGPQEFGSTYTPHPTSVGAGGSVKSTIQDQNNMSGFVCGTAGVGALAVQIIDGVLVGYAEQAEPLPRP
jgi:hypothetical protein